MSSNLFLWLCDTPTSFLHKTLSILPFLQSNNAQLLFHYSDRIHCIKIITCAHEMLRGKWTASAFIHLCSPSHPHTGTKHKPIKFSMEPWIKPVPLRLWSASYQVGEQCIRSAPMHLHTQGPGCWMKVCAYSKWPRSGVYRGTKGMWRLACRE